MLKFEKALACRYGHPVARVLVSASLDRSGDGPVCGAAAAASPVGGEDHPLPNLLARLQKVVGRLEVLGVSLTYDVRKRILDSIPISPHLSQHPSFCYIHSNATPL